MGSAPWVGAARLPCTEILFRGYRGRGDAGSDDLVFVGLLKKGQCKHPLGEEAVTCGERGGRQGAGQERWEQGWGHVIEQLVPRCGVAARGNLMLWRIGSKRRVLLPAPVPRSAASHHGQ